MPPANQTLNNAVKSVEGRDASLDSRISAAYGAQLSWRQMPIKERLGMLSQLRELLVSERHELARSINLCSRQGFTETLTAEIMPLADSIAWLSKCGRRILGPRYSKARLTPLWMGAVRSTIYRDPYGIILIIGASNYPLYLTGIQVTQALAAGNGVVIKPAPGAEEITRRFAELLELVGIPAELVIVLGSEVEQANEAISIGVDKVILTSSSSTGRNVLKNLTSSITPATMELSGCDAVYVLPGADLHRVCKVVLFGLRLNGGATCMAPRRIFVTKKSSEVFHRLLKQELSELHQRSWRTEVPAAVYRKLFAGVEQALAGGAQYFESEQLETPRVADSKAASGSETVRMGHVVLSNVLPEMQLASADIFAPLLMIISVDDWAHALQADSQCPYALTASIYGPAEEALRLANYISAGVVTINDTIVPTADPQTPFGGRGESGYGVTQGNEGLLEMTVPKVVSIRKGSWLPHATPLSTADGLLLDGVLQLNHVSTWSGRWKAVRQITRAVIAKRKDQKSR